MPQIKADINELQVKFLQTYKGVSNFKQKIAIVYTNVHYDKTRKKHPKMRDLPWVVNDRINIKAMLALMGFKPDNIFEFSDSDLDTIKKGDEKIIKLI